jgi:hypothetical protein
MMPEFTIKLPAHEREENRFTGKSAKGERRSYNRTALGVACLIDHCEQRTTAKQTFP